jgi:hypothetical protein
VPRALLHRVLRNQPPWIIVAKKMWRRCRLCS